MTAALLICIAFAGLVWIWKNGDQFMPQHKPYDWDKEGF